VLTNTESLVLGFLLFMGPCTGYDIVKRAKRSPIKSITGGAGVIYPAIKGLAEREWLQGTTIRQGSRPEKTVWSITKTGLKSFLGWVAVPVTPEQYRNSHTVFEFKCLQCYRLHPKALRSFVAKQRAVLEAYRGQLEQYQEAVATGGPFADLTVGGIRAQLDYDIQMLQAILSRCSGDAVASA
jgi:DNA-binding PadR family transcriptional regulator